MIAWLTGHPLFRVLGPSQCGVRLHPRVQALPLARHLRRPVRLLCLWYDLKFIKVYIASCEGRKGRNIICDAMLDRSKRFSENNAKATSEKPLEVSAALLRQRNTCALVWRRRPAGPYNQDEAEHFVALSDHLFEGMKRLRDTSLPA